MTEKDRRPSTSRRPWTVAIALSTVFALTAAAGCAQKSPDTADGAQQPPTRDDCEVTDVGDDTEQAMSPSGEYTARKGDPVVVEHGNESTEIDDDSSNTLYVNSSGVVVGSRGPYDMGDNGTPWVYRDGEVADLEAPDKATNVTISALSEDGTVFGVIDTNTAEEDEESNGERIPAVWEPGETEPTLPDDAPGIEITGITAEGDAVGNKGREPWKLNLDGDSEAVPSVPERKIDENDVEDDVSLHAYGDSLYDGAVVDVSGDWLLSKSHKHDFYRWNMSDEGKPEKLEIRMAEAIDDQGRVYGLLPDHQDTPMVEDDKGMSRLPKPEKKFSELKVTEASLDGKVLTGRALPGNGQTRLVTWECK